LTDYTTQAIRNLALVGHAGSGKTSLAEAMLLHAGVIGSAGTVERGNTVTDYDPQERELQHSLEPTVCHLSHQDKHINVLDTPGYPDFLPRAISVLPAVETAVVVVNAQNGIELVTQRMMEAAGERGLGRMIVVNKIDAPDINLEQLVNAIRETFGNECLPMNLPANGGEQVVDCFFAPSGEATDFSSVADAHTQIVDQIVEVDESLMEVYLEQGEVTPEQLHDPFEQALREGHLIPICFVSAKSATGLDQYLDIVAKLLPNPLEGNPPPFYKGEGGDAQAVPVTPDPDSHAIAHVFKVSIDSFVGRMGIFRIHQGTITPNSQLYIGDARKPFKVGHLLKLQGKEHVDSPAGIPGDICAITKVDEVFLDAVLHDSHDEDNYHLKALDIAPPMFGVAVSPMHRGDEQKLSDALNKLGAEDPCVLVEHNVAANETVLRGTGELHLRVLMDKMKERYNVEVETKPPSIPYRETITAAAEGHHRHKKQTGGAGQFGEVFLKVAALPRGSGFEFENKIVGGAIPSQFVPAVEKGVRQVLEGGAIAGYPLQDVRVTVYDGKHHAVDSKEIAFVAAGKKAFMDAINKAKPIILEPFVELKITAPGDTMGDITGDISGKRGRINGTESKSSGEVEISGSAPLAELNGYQSKLKSITGGQGSYTMSFSHYEPVPPKTQSELKAAFKPGEDDD
jgi:elongation factor G